MNLLVRQQQAVFLQCPADAVDPFHLATPGLRCGIVIRIQVHPIAACVLGRVAGGIHLRQQLLQRGHAQAEYGAADAGADRVALPVPDEYMRLDGAAQALRRRHRLVGTCDVGQQHAELVTAQPHQHVLVAQLLAHLDRQLHQQLVTGDMSRGVVDQLELVEVDEQQPLAFVVAGRQ